MPNYKEMYFTLFHKVTQAIQLLQEAQQEAEEIFISDEANNPQEE